MIQETIKTIGGKYVIFKNKFGQTLCMYFSPIEKFKADETSSSLR